MGYALLGFIGISTKKKRKKKAMLQCYLDLGYKAQAKKKVFWVLLSKFVLIGLL